MDFEECVRELVEDDTLEAPRCELVEDDTLEAPRCELVEDETETPSKFSASSPVACELVRVWD